MIAARPPRVARDILAAIDRPFQVNGHRIVIGTSIGIAIAPSDGDSVVDLLKNADLALYRAKGDGKASFRYFRDGDGRRRAGAAPDGDGSPRRARQRRAPSFTSSPCSGLTQGRVTAFEALLRWNHPERGSVTPLQFIPVAEETGLIMPIGEWVIREACRIAASWPTDIRVAVNVSPVQFRSNTLNRIILQALAESGIEPNRLELEITESLFIDDVEGTLASLHSLRALGVRVALDDFGTGYSSLSYLRSFPFDKIKIDRSFIVDLLSHDGATAIIKSITSLAEALGMETTAEGVENIDQLDILRDQGCSHIQGYYFSKPMPAVRDRPPAQDLRTVVEGGLTASGTPARFHLHPAAEWRVGGAMPGSRFTPVRAAFAIIAALLGSACSPLKTFDALVFKDRGSERVEDGIAYGPGPRHMLDIYAPKKTGSKPLPVVVFFYGGGWNSGTRQGYAFVGRALAARGFVAVVPDYRVVPEVRYPGFIEDGAGAVRWVEKHVARYGGDPGRIVLAGHSAGAYIAAMLAVDDRWLGADRNAVRGFVGLAGPYDFYPFDVPASRDAFGSWPRAAETQPVTWATPGDPPSLLLVGDEDVTVQPRNSTALAAKLEAAHVPVRVVRYPRIGHVGLLTAIAQPFRGRAAGTVGHGAVRE